MLAQGQNLGNLHSFQLLFVPLSCIRSGQLSLQGMPAAHRVPSQGLLSFHWPLKAGSPRSRSTLAKYILDQARL